MKLNEILKQLEAENKILPDLFSDSIKTITLKEARERFGNTEAIRSGEYGVEILNEKTFNFGGWASRRKK